MGKYSIDHGYKKDKHWPSLIVFFILTISILAPAYWYSQLNNLSISFGGKKLSTKTLSENTPQNEEENPTLPWPAYGQSAYGASDFSEIAVSKKEAESVPIASLAKVVTALAVLDKKPLKQGEQGESFTLTKSDVAIFHDYVTKSGTVVPVIEGEQISEYQALQAMLLPSGNNIADSLAIRVFGSIEQYNEYANNMLRELGIENTNIADASGFSPKTKSTASDMVKIGINYVKEPVLRDIASQPLATVPYAGQIKNYNSAINNGGVIGLKVGYTDEAKRTFLVADVQENGEVSVVSVLGAETIQDAMEDAKNILKSGNSVYESR